MDNEYMELVDELIEFSRVAKKEIEKIVQKGDLTPSEVDSVYKISCIAEKLSEIMEGQDESMQYGYGRDSYGMRRGYSRNAYGRRNYNYGEDRGYSEDRNRSPVTGRYISRGMSDGGYSGHSIEDRMIASLEQQMDEAQSDYERKIIEKEIEHIRNGK